VQVQVQVNPHFGPFPMLILLTWNSHLLLVGNANMLLHVRTLQKGLSAIYHLKNLLNCLERMLFCIIMLVLQIIVMDISCSVIMYDSMLFVPTDVQTFSLKQRQNPARKSYKL
jgi:hypothetical protein